MLSSMDTQLPALVEVCADASGCNYNVVNECASGTHDCSAYATCLDTFGRSLYFSYSPYHILFLTSLQESNNHKDVQLHLCLSTWLYWLRHSLLRYQRVFPRLYHVWTGGIL